MRSEIGYAYVVFAIWQIMSGLALVFGKAKVYAKCDNPQAQRVAELAGIGWLVLGYLTYEAGKIVKKDLLARKIVWGAVVFNAAFSLLAGPLRLTKANKREQWLVPINTGIVIWTIAALLSTRSA
mmetsp:Transcript_38166/g.75690  ORF Transcript_38166/g.75690 Transcript_38166/m.75690 type:complete len:125 (-) Transcript_38166:72-446(-)